MPIWIVAHHAFRNIPCIALFHFLWGFGSILGQCSDLFVVLSVFLWAVFLIFLLSSVRLPFSSPVFFPFFLNFRLLGRVRLGSRLFHCFVRSLVPPFSHACFCRLANRGKAAEESMSGRNGGGLGGPVVAVAEVLPVGYLPPPGKGKGKISEIRYPGGSEYLRATMRYADAVGLSRVEPSFAKIFATRYGPFRCPNLVS